jgi:multicomponent Na+:H+ antiporter subunit G
MIGELLALLGSILVLLAAVGVLRFQDPLARMHALAKASTLGVLLLFAGATINLTDVNDTTSVALAAVLHVLTSPPASNMLSRATYLAYGMPSLSGAIDEGSVRLRSRP